jgi:hypothetical protein
MGTETAFTILTSLLSILGLVYLFFWRYKALCTDSFRQKLFELRDELFDYAADGNISFDHPAYGTLRKTINGYIRFAHKTTAWHGLIFAVFFWTQDRKQMMESYEGNWNKGLASLTPEAKQRMQSLRRRLEKVALVYCILSAPELMLLLLPIVLILLLILLFVGLLMRIGLSVADSRIPEWANLRKRLAVADDVAMLYGA